VTILKYFFMKVIVICTGNTCRSQIAEGLLKDKYPEIEVHSAGTKPEAQVNPYAIKAMNEYGVYKSSIPKTC